MGMNTRANQIVKLNAGGQLTPTTFTPWTTATRDAGPRTFPRSLAVIARHPRELWIRTFPRPRRFVDEGNRIGARTSSTTPGKPIPPSIGMSAGPATPSRSGAHEAWPDEQMHALEQYRSSPRFAASLAKTARECSMPSRQRASADGSVRSTRANAESSIACSPRCRRLDEEGLGAMSMTAEEAGSFRRTVRDQRRELVSRTILLDGGPHGLVTNPRGSKDASASGQCSSARFVPADRPLSTASPPIRSDRRRPPTRRPFATHLSGSLVPSPRNPRSTP